jgi:hypothetical protein
METEIGVAVAATAAAVSPRARNLLRQGAVYGLAGAMKAGDVVFSAARGVVRGAAAGVSHNGSSARSSPSRASSTRTRSRSTRSARSTRSTQSKRTTSSRSRSSNG